MKEINCNLCGENKTKFLFRGRDRRINIKDQTIFSVVRCQNCGLVYLNPQPSYQELKPFYNENYFHWYGKKGLIRGFFKKILYSQNPKFYKWKVIDSKKNGKFLDIGCSTGIKDAKFMKDFPGWEFYGIEPDEIAFQDALKIKGFKAKKGFLEDANYPEKFFDAILMNQVLEHISNPKETIKECYRILKDDGNLIITVPDFGSLDSKMFGRFWYHLDIPRHLFHFNKQTLARVLRESGFFIEKIEKEWLSGGMTKSILQAFGLTPRLLDGTLSTAIRVFFSPLIRSFSHFFYFTNGFVILAKKF